MDNSVTLKKLVSQLQHEVQLLKAQQSLPPHIPVELYQTLLEKADVAIAYFSIEGKLIFVNSLGAHNFGSFPGELIGKYGYEFLTPDLANLTLKRIQQITQTGLHQTYEDQFLSDSSEKQWSLTLGQPVFDKEHEIIGVEFIFQNITPYKELETVYQGLLDHSLQGVLVLQDELIIFANEAAGFIFNRPQVDLLVTLNELIQYLHPEDIEMVLSYYQARKSGGQVPPKYDFRIVHPDGEIHWVEIGIASIQFHHKPALQIGFLDITERKKVEESHRQQAAYLAALQEISMGLISNLDMETSLNSILQSAISLSKAPNGFIATFDSRSRALTIRIGTGSFKSHVGLRYSTNKASIFNRILKTKQVEVIQNSNLSKTIEFPAWITTIAIFPLYSSKHQIVGELGLAHHEIEHNFDETQIDIINRLAQLASIVMENARLHTSLREEEEKLRHIIEEATEGIVLVDQFGKMMEWNRAQEKITGISRKEAAKLNLMDFIAILQSSEQNVQSKDPDLIAFINSPHPNQSRLTGKILETSIKHKNGSFRTIQISFLNINSQQGPLSGTITRDITEIKRMEKQLMDSQRLAGIGTLAAGIAHEINTPLQIITGSSEILAHVANKDNISPEILVRKLEMINRSSWRIAEIVRSLQDYARSTPRNMEIDDINNIVKDVLVLLENQLLTKYNIQVITQLEPSIPKMICEHNNIIQVLINLINNARDAMPNGGQITITTQYISQNEQIVITVNDTGSGILDEIIDKVFDPFFTTKPLGQGMGLGLSIVTGIVRSHQGTIDIKSIPDQGTAITLSFPRHGPVIINTAPNKKQVNARFDE